MKKFLKHFRYGEKGFTLIELLVVIAILGVLAAVVVPNVSKFMGAGKDESGLTELHSVQTAVTAMMADRGIVVVTNSENTTASPVNDMTIFPSADTHPTTGLSFALFTSDTRYLQKDETEYWYNCASDGVVRGWWTSAGSSTATNEIGIDAAP